MGLKVYLPAALVAAVTATTGSDLFARISIAGETFWHALSDHLFWAGVQFIGTAMLFAPFVGVAFLCTRVVEKDARTRSAVVIFAIAILALMYFYFQGYQGAQYALLEKKWTAATLSVGLLPFFIGVPVALGVLVAGALAAKFDPKS